MGRPVGGVVTAWLLPLGLGVQNAPRSKGATPTKRRLRPPTPLFESLIVEPKHLCVYRYEEASSSLSIPYR